MCPRNLAISLLLAVMLVSATASISTAAPGTPVVGTPSPATKLPKNSKEICRVMLSKGSSPSVDCLLYLLAPDGKVDFKQLQILGIGLGKDYALLDQPQVVDATSRTTTVSGPGKAQSGQARAIVVQPSDYTLDCFASSDLELWDDAGYSGNRLCFFVQGDSSATVPYLGDITTPERPGGWNDVTSSYRQPCHWFNVRFYADASYAGFWANTTPDYSPTWGREQWYIGDSYNDRLSSLSIAAPVTGTCSAP